MKPQQVLILICMLALFSQCEAGKAVPQKGMTAASELAATGQLTEAFDLLKKEAEQGTPLSFDEFQKDPWRPLIEDPALRPKVRNFFKAYGHENTIHMAPDSEPGSPIIVGGQLLDGVSGLPIPGVQIELVQADSAGMYFMEPGSFNPRLFGYIKTDERGQFEVRTIRPGNYQDDLGQQVPSHIHFSIEAPGFRPYYSEFVLGDDPYFDADQNPENLVVATLSDEADRPRYWVTIMLQAVD